MMFIRVGEAANPGPNVQIGCVNPTGILNKGQTIEELPRGSGGTIWAVSETHLSSAGRSKLYKEFSCHKSDYYLQLGADVPTRSSTISSIGGKQRGVGFLSTLPCRSMSATWDLDAWKQSRFHLSCFMTNNRWIQGGVVYGYAKQPTTVETKSRTDEICQHVHTRLVEQSTGLRFIGGDFNQEGEGTQTMQKWVDAGWVNVQVWAAQKLNKPIQFTSKGKTVKDHLFVSPELAMYLQDVFVEEAWFPDHAVLRAVFRDLGKPPNFPVWKQPSSIDWNEVGFLPEQEGDQKYPTHDMNAWYSSIAEALEKRVDEKLKSLHKPGLMSHQKGRAQTMEVRWVTEYSSPPKVAREGETQPEFHGIDQQHAKWIRQARRLDCYARGAKGNFHFDSQRAIHQDHLWQSINRTSGFGKNFTTWWQQNQTCDIKVLPSEPPGEIVANKIAEHFRSHLRKLEQALNRKRIHMAKQRRQDDPNVIFRDLKADQPAPVQVLIDHCVSTIAEVLPDESACVLSNEVKWSEETPILHNNLPIETIQITEDKLWVENIERFHVGDEVKQDNYIGDLTELFEKFGHAWRQRWDRHASTDCSFWDPIVDFARTTLPVLPHWQYEPITYQEWMSALRKKRKRAATGPDAMARLDLINMPKDLVDQLLALLAKIESGSTWPQQAVVGFVVSLEKVAGASSTNAYRPITVLSVAYRTWGSIRAKQILAHLEPIAPMTCTGNLPRRQASQVWVGIQKVVEEAVVTGRKVAGAVIDLVKAFNLLPRYPVMAIMEHLNVPHQILHAWHSSINQLHRRFKIRGAVGPPERSCTGFAEGDALSVTAMLAVNLVAHSWIKHKCQLSNLWSYVDNLEVTCEDAATTMQCLNELDHFTKILDVEIDQEKTYVWSVDPQDRAVFRINQLAIKGCARDLGGHVQYNRCATNSTITKKLEHLGSLWGRLSRSLAPYRQKIRALVSKAWPLSLHAIASAHLGEEHFVKMRAGAIQGLQCQKAGMSPVIHLSLIEDPRTDPQFYSLMSTVVNFRLHHSPEEAGFVLQYVASQMRQRPLPGPASVLINRLFQIGWSWEQGTVFRDHQRRPIDILFASYQEIAARIQQGWQDRVLGIASNRKSMGGLNCMHPGLTTQGMLRLAPDEQPIMRTCLNGTFFTANYLAKRDPTHNGTCEYCQVAPDSQQHRHWVCPFFDSCRTHLTQAQIQDILSLPDCTKNHGWIPEPPSLRAFQKQCILQSDHANEFDTSLTCREYAWFFTDGGCRVPASNIHRLASWGVAIGDPSTDQIQPLSCGMVPGMVQNTLRAEIWAMISACRYAAKMCVPCSFCIDNDLVFKRVCKFKNRECWFKVNQKDSDLWAMLYEAVRSIRHRIDIILKVVSHQEFHDSLPWVDQWCIRGNNAADSIATHAVLVEPRTWQLWQQVHAEISELKTFKMAVHQTIIAVGKKAVRNRKSYANEAPPRQPRITREDIAEIGELKIPDEVPLRWKFHRLPAFVKWFNNNFDHQSPVRLVSWFQLAILHAHDGHAPFAYQSSSKRWFQGPSSDRCGDFVKRSNHLSKVIRGLYGVSKTECRVLHIRPASDVLQFWTQCIAFRICPQKLALADDLLRESQDVYRTVRSLRGLD